MVSIFPKITKVRKLLRAFKKLGFKGDGTKHHKLVDSRGRIATITRSKKEIPRKMFSLICKEADLSEQEIEELISHL